MKAEKIVIVGAGAVGQVIGAKLIGAGHQVTMVVRPARAAELRHRGLRLRDRAGEEENARPAAVAGGPEEIAGSRWDWVFVAVRAEQLAETVASLAQAGVAGERLVICAPIWGPEPALEAGAFGERLMLLPGMLAGQEDGAIRYRLVKTRVGPLSGAITPGARDLGSLLELAGMPARVAPDLGLAYVDQLAVGLPWAIAVENTGFDLGALARDRATRRTAARAAREAVALAEKRSGRGGAATRAAARLSGPFVGVGACALAPLSKVGWGRIAWAHVKKIAVQDREMLRALYQWGAAHGEHTPALAALIGEA